MMLILKIVLQVGTLIGTCLIAVLDYSWRDKRTSIFKKGRFWLYTTLLILFPISIFVTIFDEQEKKREIEERDNEIAELSKISKWGITVANRAYISVDHMQFSTPLEANKPVALIFEFVNDGNSPAEITGSATYYLDPNLQQCEYNSTPTFKGIVVAPKSPRTHLVNIAQKGFSQGQLDDIQEGRKYLQICIRSNYTTLNESYPFENCSYYSPEMRTFMECKKE